MKWILLLLLPAVPLMSQAQTTSTLVPLGSVWKYLDDGSNQGPAWRAEGFADAAWAQGAGELGYGDGDEATTVSYGPNASAKYITTYFRKHFTVASAAAITAANLRLRRDDGVVIYLNGTEIYRNTMPTGTITHTTLATAAIGGADETALLAATVNAALLVEGGNVLAVEVHQSNATSSDLTFDLEFNVTATAPPVGAPLANAQSVTLSEDTAAAVTLTGSDPEESPLTFSIVTAPAKGSLTGTPPAVTYLPDANTSGADSFTFKVNDGTSDSPAATVSLTVTGENDAPVADGQDVTAANGAAVTVTLSGSDVESRFGLLSDYTQEFYSSDLTTITDGLSGATWNADTGTLFLIRNVSAGGGTSYEYTADGTPLRTITQSGFQDTEAIAWMYGNTYAIAEENDFQRITICTIAPGATILDRTAAGHQTWNTGVGSLLNLGIESLCYDAGRDLLYYLAEKPSGGTWNIYAMNPATGVSTVLCDLNAGILAAGVATDVGDMAFDQATDTVLLLSHESSKIIRVSRSGAVLEQRGFTTALTQAEALALTPDRQRLFIGGEPRQFARYALPVETLTYQITTLPAHGTLSGLPPTLTYVPAAGYVGPDSFTYRVNDGEFDSADATVNLTVSASVLDTLVTAGSTWKYLDNGSNQGTAWRASAFDDSSWSSGPAQLGYGDGDEAAVIGYGPDSNNRYITTYFRHEFQLVNPGAITSGLKLDLLRDDGAVVYLNGTEILRSGMPAGAVSWNTFASASISAPAESTFYTTPLSSGLLLPGRNVLAVEVHQGAVTSTDLSFDLRLYEAQPAITRGPYVQMTGTDRATVRWRTDVATTSRLDYGPSTAALTSTASGASLKTEHEITVTGLMPDTRYYYGAGHSSGLLSSGSTFYFTTHPPAGTVKPYRFWVLGDPGTGDANQTAVRDAFYTWNGAAELAGVLVLGDTVYETGTDLEFQNKFFNVYPTLMRNTPFWPTFGNHDAGSASSSTQSGPYYDSFTMPKAGEAGGVASGTEAYYSFNIGNIHFVCLDSEGSSLLATGNMAAWLEQDLNANLQEWTVAFWHHPAYSKGAHDSDVATADSGKMKNMREIFVPILENHGVDLLLFGHEHNYQRSKFIDGHYDVSSTFDPATMVKQTGLGDPAVDGPYVKSPGPHNGAVFTVAGSSGKLTVATLNHAAMAVNRTELGSVVLDVTGRELMARFINSTGVVRDTFSIVHNSAPLANEATFTGMEDAPLAVTLGGTDVENDVLTYAITTPPAVGTLTGTAPDLTYTPPADFQGSTSFQFTVSDGRGTSAPVTVTLNLSAVNDAPLAPGQSVSTAEDVPAAITLAGSDADGDLLTYVVTTQPIHGILSGTAPALIYTPEADWSGADSLAFTVSDGTLTSAPAAVSLTVTPVNDVPLAVAQSVVTDEDTAVPVTLTASDVDGDVLTFTVTVPPAHGLLSGTAPALTYTPAPDWNGPDQFEFTAHDAAGAAVPAMVTITVAPVNDAPVAVGQTIVTMKNVPVATPLQATDTEGDALTYVVTVPPAHGTLSGTAPALTYTPEANWNGTDSFAYTAGDAAGTSPAATVTLTVSATNTAPVAVAQAVATAEDTPAALSLAGTDAEGNTLTFVITAPPLHGSLSGTLPDVIYTPEPDWNGADEFTFLVNDGTEDSLQGQVAVSVTPVNDVPEAVAQAISTEEDLAATLVLAGSDVDGDALTFSVTVLPAHGTLSGAGAGLLYTPDPNWNGADSFSFTAGDGIAVSTPAVVSLTVTAVNDLPVATAVSAATEVGIPVALTLTGSDAEGDALTWNIASAPAHGTLSGSGAAWTYTPDPAWAGTDEFTFTVSDGSGTSPATPATITVASTGPWQLIARTGHAAPGAGGAAFSTFQADYVSDASGRASFRATAGSVTGIWTEGPAGLEAVAVQAAAAPGVTGAVFDAITTGPWAAGDGELLVFGKLRTGTGGVTTSNDLGYWHRSSGAVALVARENDPVPGMPAAARFNVLSAVATLEAGGNYAFAGSMKTNSSLAITAANDTGLWATFGAPARLLVRENQAAPGTTGLFDTLTTAGLVSNGAGQLGFTTSMKTGGTITTANRYGLWMWDPAQFGLVARSTSAAPGTPTGALFGQPLQPSFGDGAMAFRSALGTGSGGVTNSNESGLWVLENGLVNLLAREGFQAPGVAAGGVFNGFTEGASLNRGHELAFRTALRSGPGVTSANNAGLWVRSRFTGNTLTLAARKGFLAPGAGNATFASFDVPFVADDGGEVFTATLTVSTATGVTSSNDRGLWLRNAAGALTPALREGTTFTLAPGDIRTISNISLPATPGSGRTPLSGEGRLLVLIVFTNESSALYHYVLP